MSFERLRAEALNVGRRVSELGALAVQALFYKADQALDCWPDDSPEDAAIPSHVSDREAA